MMSIIASSAIDLKFHQWPEGIIHHTYVPTKHEESPIKSICWGRDGSWVVLVPSSGPAEVISIRENIKLLQAIDQIYQPTCAIFQNGTKKHIAVGTSGGQVLLYDLKCRNVRKRFPRCGSTICQLKYNAKDTHLAATCENGDILVYNNMTLNISSSFRVPDSESASSINFHRTKRNLLSAGSEEGIVAAWDINNNAVLCKLQAHQAPVTNLSFSPIRSDLLVTSGLDRRVSFFDIVAKKCVFEIEVENSITAFDFSSCGTYLGLGSLNGTINIYDTRSLNKPISTFVAHEGKKIRHLMFQKLLLAADEKNNSVYNIHLESDPSEQNDLDTEEPDFSALVCDSPTVNVIPEAAHQNNTHQNSLENQTTDSFMAALGLNASNTSLNRSMERHETESTYQTSLVLGITEEVKKWMNTSRPSLLKKTLLTNSKEFISTPTSSMNSRLISSTPNNNNPDAVNTSLVVTPISDAEGCSSETKTLQPHVCFSRDELKTIIKECVKEDGLKEIIKECIKEELEGVKMELKEEINSNTDSLKMDLKDCSMEISGNMRRLFLDMRMTVIKEFINFEEKFQKVNNESAKEFICDSFLINLNNNLRKELDVLREQLVEKDQIRR